MSANSLNKDDVVVAISHSGTTSALVDTVKTVRSFNACVIGLMPSGTPLSKECDISLEIDVGDSIDSYVVEEARRRLESYYHEKGYDAARVTTVEGTKPGDKGAVQPRAGYLHRERHRLAAREGGAGRPGCCAREDARATERGPR